MLLSSSTSCIEDLIYLGFCFAKQELPSVPCFCFSIYHAQNVGLLPSLDKYCIFNLLLSIFKMPPTEDELLSNFLLAPAPLASVISLQKFTDLFPRPQRPNPQIKLLYRDLQGRRALDIEHIKRNIAREVKRGEKQKRHVIKARRKGAYEENEPKEGRAKSAKTEVSA